MTPEEMTAFGKIGGTIMLGLSAIGSGMGAGVAALAAIGAWKKCYAQNKLAPFLLVAFIGAQISQTINGFIVMRIINAAARGGEACQTLVAGGVLRGLAMCLYAWLHGRAGAACTGVL